jgi:hypothetical protein
MQWSRPFRKVLSYFRYLCDFQTIHKICNIVKQFKFRQRRHSIPHVDLSSWDNYYSEIFPYPILHDQVFLIRPEYDSSADYGNCIDDIMSDCSPVNYILSDQDTTKDDHLSEESASCHSPFNEFSEKQVVEVSIETISNK